MKMLYLANIRLPTEKAHGMQTMKMCEAFAEAGCDITLAVPTRRNVIREDPFTYYGIHSRFCLMRLVVPDLLSFGKIGYLISLYIFSERARFLDSFWASDIIYSRDALVLARYVLLGRKLVFEAHERPTFLARFVALRAYRVVVISKGLERAYVDIGIEPEKIIVAPDAVDLDLFTTSDESSVLRRKLGLPLDKKIVMYTGSFYRYAWKGVDVLLDAAAYLPDKYLVVVVGASEIEYDELRGRNVSSRVRIIRRRPHQEIPLYLKASDVLVLPNKKGDATSEFYTSPLKLFEYMASGVPIVASRLPSIEEILSEQNSCLVEAGDASKLANGIRKVVDDGQLGQSVASQARADVLSHTWSQRAKTIRNFIEPTHV